MEAFKIEAIEREDVGKKSTKAVRANNRIPCILYGGEKNVHFTVGIKDVKDLIYTPDFHKVEIQVGGKSYGAIIKDIQFHPVTDAILHIDFQELIAGRTVRTEIPVHTVGVPEGVKEGGKLALKVRKLKVKATPDQLKEHITIDVTHLTLGQSFKVRDIEGEAMEITNPMSIPVATVEIPRSLRSGMTFEEELAAEAAEAAEVAGGEAEATEGDAGEAGGSEE